MKKIFLLLLFSFFLPQAFGQPKMQGTIKQDPPGSNKIDVYLKSSETFSQKDEQMILALAIPAIVSPAPSMGSSGVTTNGTGLVTGITGLQPNFITNNLGATQREVLVTTETINGVPHYVYIFIFAGTADNPHNWTANEEQLIFSIAFEGCTAGCNFRGIKLVSLPSGGGTGQGFWYFQANTAGDITDYATPFYGNPQTKEPVNGGGPEALSVLELNPAPLPVKLAAFNAAAKDCNVRLSWQVTQEINFSYYAVERGENATSFIEIGRVDAPANSNALKSYAFTDNGAAAGAVFYRLRFVNRDGSYAYSPVKTVTLNCSGKNTVLVYPTLSTGTVIVKLPPVMENAKINVVNAAGEIVLSNENKGFIRVLNLTKLANGAYTVQVVDKGEVREKVKVLLQR